MRALSLNCSVARGNQCGGGEGFTSSPICRVPQILVQGCYIGSLLEEMLRINQLWVPNKRFTKNNNFGRSEGAKADLHQGRWQLVNISDIFLDPIDQ